MARFKFDNIKISGIASAVPTKIIKSTDYNERFGEDAVQKFVDMTGVKEHRESLLHQTASDFGYAAAEKLLTEKNIDRETIGVLLFGAHSTDYRRPATACVLHKRLGLSRECVAFDVGLGCSAFVYCVQIAASLLECSQEKRALIIVGETMTKMINPEDKSAAMLFGDGGAAVLLEKAEDSCIEGKLCSDGTGYRAIIAPAGGFRNLEDSHEPMVWADGSTRTLYNTNMNGTDVFSFTVTKVPKTIKEFLSETEQDVTQFDCLAFHQANQFIHQQLAKKLKADINKMPLCLDRYGNTSAPAIPILLSDAYGNDRTGQKLNVLMCGFGVGLSWGVMSAHINTDDILPIIETDELFEEGVIHSPEDMQ
ncbi:3-oxoacyl-ACP synthase III family protein [Pseudobutyrivibrio xylanivorans]|uniref:Ketoacyl-ACP synthase III n=1 Tax=Pseudobutyrivibrio xylanivorans TaxID=185007 RepID=A0A5P6VVK7_PSEXY|nr:ketoacyl-ACP synthase III [Pseudobutyrivibrio xylanivorans]QFJ56089.1 ketoacyl-ACP synthase III [Pseudobutyrivibrio xylanivorans]